MARRIDLKNQAVPEPPAPKPALRFALFADHELPVRGVSCDDTLDKFRQALKLTEDERALHKTWGQFETTGENLDLALAPYQRWIDANTSHRWADLDEVQESGHSDQVYRAYLVGLVRDERIPVIAVRGYDMADTSADPGFTSIGTELISFTEFQRKYGPVAKVEQTVWLPLNKDRQSSTTKETLQLDVSDFTTTTAPNINIDPNLVGIMGGAIIEDADSS